MKRALTALIFLSLAACAQAPAPSLPPQLTEPSEANWRLGQDAYLAWSRTRPGWQVTDSGLQYRRVGRAHPEGARPGPMDTVRVHYEGRFIDARVFDSSYQRNEPAEFPLNRVIRGWTEGLQLMRAGETFEFVIPANLAYGERWVGGDAIPPGSVLVFKVELLSVTPA